MDKISLLTYLNEVKSLPVNELNIRRFAEVTTAIKNITMLETSEAEKEIEETHESLKDYMTAKRNYCTKKTDNNQEEVKKALKELLTNIEETLKEVWSMCDCEAEKEIIHDHAKKLHEMTKPT